MGRSSFDFRVYDQPEILMFMFHPRPDHGRTPHGARQLSIPVEGDVFTGARFFHADKKAPTILLFHGNGEIAADYDDLGPLYCRMNINFMAVDYRGYGLSGGVPTVSSMMNDCHEILAYVRQYLADEGYSASVIIMGRSLGAAPALELAAANADTIAGLIIESGFAEMLPLLELMGIDTAGLGLKDDGFGNESKISAYLGPTLVIHSEYDQIIPLSQGERLFNASGSHSKSFLKIPGADHNTILMRGLKEYFAAVKELSLKVSAPH
jgi:alpha-beta hydrolase superfamily lysophospholipase